MAPKRKRAGSSGASSSRNGPRRKKHPAPPPSPSLSSSPPRPHRRRPEVIDVDAETWDVRDPELDFFYPEEEYRDAPGKFSVAFHHGGAFFENKEEKKYVGGGLTYFDECDINHFGLIDLSSMLLKLRYDKKTICEFYYCHPKYSPGCGGKGVGGPLMPIVEDEHLVEFLKVAATSTKLVHIYVLEITRAEAILKKMKDEAQEVLNFWPSKSAGVVIEEIDEPQPTAPVRPPRRKKMQEHVVVQNKQPLMIGWYERDVEFEEFLVNSLESDRARRKRDAEVARQNLEKAFEEVAAEDAKIVPDIVEAIPQSIPDDAEAVADVEEVALDEDIHAHVQEVINSVAPQSCMDILPAFVSCDLHE